MKTYTKIRPGAVLVEEDGAEPYIVTPVKVREMLDLVRDERAGIIQRITELETELDAIVLALNRNN